MESIISTFHIDWKIMIAQAVNFAIVFVVLYIFALKPLSKMMGQRSEKISKGINDAKENATLLEKTKVEYENVLRKARLEANKIFEEGKKEAETKKTEMLEEAKNEVTLTIENGKKILEAEKTKLVNEAKSEIVNLAVSITEKLIEGKIDPSFSEKALKELSNLK